jgi:hypothetical protein
MPDATCGHCGRPITTAARGWAADGTALCHTGIIPPIAQPMDCYKLVTTWGHQSNGECCRTPAVQWVALEIPVLALLPWAASLTVEQRTQMLDETATDPDPAGVIRRWKRVADAAWPLRIHVEPPREPGPGYGLSAAYERGRRQGRYEAGG